MLNWASLVLTGLVVIVGSNDILNEDDSASVKKNDANSQIVYPNDLLLHQHSDGSTNVVNHNYRNFLPGFQHDHHFHSRVRGDLPPDFPRYHSPHSPNVVSYGPGHSQTSTIGPREDTTSDIDNMTIPLDLIKNISQYTVNDLLQSFVEGDVNFEEPFLNSRFGDEEGTARSSASTPMKANCIPEYRTIKLVNNDDPSILYIPQCTRVEQCGGCCSHALLSCQPIETETIAYQVMKTKYTGNKKFKFLGKEVKIVEKHTKCKCDCIVKEKDCNQYQQYQPAECRCTCKNIDEEEKCHQNSGKKLWNPDLCACQCRETLLCSTGYYYDQNECKCSATPMNRRFATYEIRVSDNGAVPSDSPYREGN